MIIVESFSPEDIEGGEKGKSGGGTGAIGP